MSLRILIAEDSAIFAAVIEELLCSEPDLEVIGVAVNGVEAVEMCARLRPDLVMMDIHMPLLDGLSATEQIMASSPTPILVVTSDPHSQGVNLSFKALSAGALDLVAKPTRFPLIEFERESLLRKVRLLAQIPVVRHMRGRRTPQATPAPGDRFGRRAGDVPVPDTRASTIIGIVASTGGPRALARLLADLPADFSGALLIVQHITQGFSAHLAAWLDAHSALTVLEAEHAMVVRAGHAYIAPTELHMELAAGSRLRLFEGDAVGGHRPSGDLLLVSIAQHATRAAGVVLSGMGNDGTDGIAALHRVGALTLAQDQESSVVYSMPRSAIERGVIERVVKLERLAAELSAHAESGARRLP
ncbi:MAG: chemotaxis-specific protein-glutamate methyltransferase CheB [Bradymonadaceae bacterium]|nr:chemotaxis-specific protein-glutamate methyltransferase CheB [Lujinxingiaceae bacterium]